MEKSKIIKYSCFGAGIFFILAGLLLILIPSFTLPNYSMYKNGAVVSNDYSFATSEEEYLKTIYSSLNADEESYFLLTNELDDIEKEKISSKINISSIYDTNFNENGKNISVNISLAFEYSEEFIVNLNSEAEKISAYPSIYLLLETNEKEIKSSSLNLLPLADSLRARSLGIEATSLAISTGLSIALLKVPHPALITLIDMGVGTLLEFIVPMPDEFNPEIIKKDVSNNPSLLGEWAINQFGF